MKISPFEVNDFLVIRSAILPLHFCSNLNVEDLTQSSTQSISGSNDESVNCQSFTPFL